MPKMIPSLRTLCLEKVISQGDDYSDLPQNVVKDIELMKLFNGRYLNNGGYFNNHRSRMLTIYFDGKEWNFKLRVWEEYEVVCFCKICCNSFDMSITVRKGDEGPKSHIWDFLLTCCGYLDHSEAPSPTEMTGWKFDVEVPSFYFISPKLSWRNTSVVTRAKGAIVFHGLGKNGTRVNWASIFQVEVDEPSQSDGSETRYLHMSLPHGEFNLSQLFVSDRCFLELGSDSESCVSY